jgi:lycopene cyclase domain-containing protein
MKLSQFSYLLSIILFCGPLILLIWKREARILKKYELALFVSVLVSMPIAVGEFYALKWQAWAYYPNSVLNVRLGGQLESYLFLTAVIVLVGSVTLVLATRVDKKTPAARRLKYKAMRASTHKGVRRYALPVGHRR